MRVRLFDVLLGAVAFAGGAATGGWAASRIEGPPAAEWKLARPAYACPMHAEVTSHRKEDRCPKCGMVLEAVTKE